VYFGTVLFRTLLAEGSRWESVKVARGQPKSADGSRPLPIPARSDSFRLAGLRKLRHVPTYEEMAWDATSLEQTCSPRWRRSPPLIKEHADSGERERHLMDPVVEALRDSGLYRIRVPRHLGGLQVDPLTFYHVVEALSRVDGSAGWCMFNSGALPISTAFLHDDAADEIFAKDPHTIMSGTIFPPGRAVPSPGGYTVSGRWVYASGCWHATWHMAVCNVCEAGANECRLGPTGLPETIVVHFPRAQMIILL
jgi:Acyl-CoA dehydrogenase, N-terminal domain